MSVSDEVMARTTANRSAVVFYGYRFPLTNEVASKFPLLASSAVDESKRVSIMHMGDSALLICTESMTSLPSVYLEDHEIKQDFLLKSEVRRVLPQVQAETAENVFSISEEDDAALRAVVSTMGLDLGIDPSGGDPSDNSSNIGFFFAQMTAFSLNSMILKVQIDHVLSLAD